jgi:hypothetical protein
MSEFKLFWIGFFVFLIARSFFEYKDDSNKRNCISHCIELNNVQTILSFDERLLKCKEVCR